MISLRPYQLAACHAILATWKECDSALAVMPTGCHAPDQAILLWDGCVKAAKDIVLGDHLMGMDGTPRKVLFIHQGQKQMVKVIPVKGEPFVVTEDHVLTLVRTREKSDSTRPCHNRHGEIIDVSILDWLTWPKWQKHIHKLFRVGVDFIPGPYLHLDPYVLGLLLGDGSFAANLNFTTPDQEAKDAVATELANFGLTLKDAKCKCGAATCWSFTSGNYRHHKSWFRKNILERIGLNRITCESKHVPDQYLTADRKARLAMLAGLLDSDGHLNNGGYDFISISPRMSHDVAFIARSVGLAAYVKECRKFCQTGGGGTYWRVSISGDCHIIPCRIPRKKAAPRLQKKDVLRTGFSIQRMGIGDYVGFTVDEDHRYLLGDFTVTHNCGKTVVFSDIIRRVFPRKALVLAHRKELINQAKDKIQRVTGFRVDVEMGDLRADIHAGLFDRPQVIVSSIQTQTAGGDGAGRMGKFDPYDYGVLIIDEAHRATAKSYRRVIDYYRQNPNLKVLGVTATPDRADEESLGQVFQQVAYDYEILDAIKDGWLVPIEQQMVEIEGLDFSGIRTTAGDLNGADLAAVMEAEKPLHGIADATVRIAGNRRTLVFAASVHQAEMLSDIFNRHRPGCAGWVCGKTDDIERAQTLADFAAGRLQYVVNVGVLTEGFDDPGVELVVMGRPTKSRALYAQMCGRALRPLSGVVDEADDSPEHRRAAIASSPKPNCLIVDFSGNAGRHKLVSTADILGGNVSDETVAMAADMARKSGQPVRMDELLEEAEEERIRALEEAKRLAAARKAMLVGKASFTTQSVNPFDLFHIRPAAPRGWDKGKEVSPKMRALIEKHYPDVNPDQLNYTQTRQLTNELFRRWDGGLATYKQVKLLAKHGIDASNLTMTEAGAAIDTLAKNGWRKVA